MKTTFFLATLLITGILFSPYIKAQTDVADLDSVAFIKAKNSFNDYKFFNRGDKDIGLLNTQSKLVQYKTSPILRNIGSGTMTMLTGIGFISSTDVNWKFSGTIKCNDALPDWSVSLFCEGSQEKDRERVRNDDGSWSVETEETSYYYWDKNATGIVTEDDDTIAFFLIIMNPREDELLKPWSDEIYHPLLVQENPKLKNSFKAALMAPQNIDYGITGIFRGKSFSIISNGIDRKIWIYIDNIFIGMFKTDPVFPTMNKKNAIVPYLLINKDVPETYRRDLFRLAMMSRFLDQSL